MKCSEPDRRHALHLDHAAQLFFVDHPDYKIGRIIAYVNVAGAKLLHIVVNLNSVLLHAIFYEPLLCPRYELLV